MNPCTLKTEKIRKVYPGTVALDRVSLDFERGRIHALIGKNGAGKSTLVKILAGAVQPTEGKIFIQDREVRLRSPRDAFDQGIATVHQELSLVPHLTVGENILLGRLPQGKRFGVHYVDWDALFEKAQTVLERMQVRLDVKKKVRELGVAQQQIVEIAKAMSFNPIALLLDEPTSALALHETRSLFSLVRKLADKGVAVIYITHRLQELPQIADTVYVLRDGRHAGTLDREEADPKSLVKLMFGQIPRKERPQGLKRGTEPILETRHLSREGAFHDVSLTLMKGEILGLAGMLGSGRTELLKALFGAEPFDWGELLVEGRPVKTPSPEKMKNLGVAFTPENRKEEGTVQGLSIRANLCLAGMGRIARRGFIIRSLENPVVTRMKEELKIQAADPEHPLSSLSGGNQQKVVVGSWLATDPKIILFDEPTRGIDINAKQQIFQVMWDLSARGISVLFVSSELEELLEVCHRIVIMKKGRIQGELSPEDLTTDELFAHCMEQ